MTDEDFKLIRERNARVEIDSVFETPETYKDGKFYLFPPKAYKIFSAIAVLISCIVTYAASQSGHCPIMTVEENLQNVRNGILAAIVFWLVTFYLMYRTYFVHFMFDMLRIEKYSPFAKKEFLWKDLSGLGYSSLGRFLKFSNDQKLYVPVGFQGDKKLEVLVNSNLLNLNHPPEPAFSEELTSMFAQKSVYVFIVRLTEFLNEKVAESFHAKAITVNPSEIVLQKDDGSLFKGAANMRSFFLIEDYEDKEYFTWDVKIPENEKVDFVAVYYETEGQEKND